MVNGINGNYTAQQVYGAQAQDNIQPREHVDLSDPTDTVEISTEKNVEEKKNSGLFRKMVVAGVSSKYGTEVGHILNGQGKKALKYAGIGIGCAAAVGAGLLLSGPVGGVLAVGGVIGLVVNGAASFIDVVKNA